MSTETELKTVGAPTARTVVTATYVSRHHALASLLWAAVAVAAAVALGQGDWYVRQLTDYSGNYVTYYYGLKNVVMCTNPAVAAPAGSTQNFIGNTALFTCNGLFGTSVQRNYNAIALADKTEEEQTAMFHLIGAGNIIIVVLSFAIVFAALAALINLQYAFRYENEAHDAATEGRHHRGSQVVGLLAFICEALAIIFWVTIFPYAYARDQENGTAPINANPGFIAYLTIGTALGIQIGGVFVALLALVVGHYRYGQSTPLPASRV